MIRFLIGTVLSIGLFWLSTAMFGAHVGLYIHIAETIAVSLIPIALTYSTFGRKRTVRAFLCSIGGRVSDEFDKVVLKRWIVSCYAISGLSFISGVVLTLSVIDQGPIVIAMKTSAALCAPLVAIIISEFFLRTAIGRGEDTAV